MNVFDVTVFDELTPAELNDVDGGIGIITVIAIVSGCITIAEAAHDFGNGFVEGWNSVD